MTTLNTIVDSATRAIDNYHGQHAELVDQITASAYMQSGGVVLNVIEQIEEAHESLENKRPAWCILHFCESRFATY